MRETPLEPQCGQALDRSAQIAAARVGIVLLSLAFWAVIVSLVR